MTILCKQTDLLNESDIEQKFILQMLTKQPPLGLGYSLSDFRTKPDIRQIIIDKGQSKKLYYPDYIIILDGLPALIIEAKGPGEDVLEAVREARLYALELNARFGKNINPCHKIIISNGIKTVACFWDSGQPEYCLEFEQIYTENPKYSEFLTFVGKAKILEYCNDIYREIRKKSIYKRPLGILGGKTIQNEEVEQNSFGASLALDYRHLFNPSTLENRANIVRNAYISSRRRSRHIEPIHKIIIIDSGDAHSKL